jgi:Domain of unknown function (DUF4331)
MSLSFPKFAQLNLKKSLVLGGISIVALLVAMNIPKSLVASDHDDGEVDTKGRNLNLTDLYAFREKDQNPAAKDGDLMLVMNTNPRSVARQQYFFSTNARYEFKLTRVADKDATPTGQEDITLRFEFSAPNNRNQQQIKFTAIKDGKEVSAQNLYTTPLNTKVAINSTPKTAKLLFLLDCEKIPSSLMWNNSSESGLEHWVEALELASVRQIKRSILPKVITSMRSQFGCHSSF